MATIQYLKDENGNIRLPVTHESAVRDSNGVTLTAKLSQKQDTLVSGSNIKTLNSTSILGEGNIDIQGGLILEDLPTANSANGVKSGGVYTALSGKQESLVSGTNIKTINNESILGSGNISVAVDVPENCETTDNKVTSLSEQSTNTQYPTAKAVYDYVEGLEDIIGDIDTVLDNITDEDDE